MASRDLTVKVKLDIQPVGDETCEGCRWATLEPDGQKLGCHAPCDGCTDVDCGKDSHGVDGLVEPYYTACHHYAPNLKARQTRALEGILVMLTKTVIALAKAAGVEDDNDDQA